MNGMQAHFLEVADVVAAATAPGETTLAWYRAERSDFARLNEGRVRQAGQVAQQRVSVRLVHQDRHAEATLDLAGDMDLDAARLAETVAALRGRVALAEPDPHLLYADSDTRSEDVRTGTLPDAATGVRALAAAAEGLDLVGIWAAGTTARGFASSAGARRWQQRDSFHLDWSVHAAHDRAVKNGLAGEHWEEPALAAALEGDRERLARLGRPARGLSPGRYRAWLAPAAMAELMGLLAWGGFGLRAQRTGTSPLAALARGERAFDPAVTLTEELALGLAPDFTADGFDLPRHLPLVEGGRFANALASPRSAREYGGEPNCADEVPQALALAPGGLDDTDAPALVGDGLEIANLWYCNYADRNDCRMTGMTRFACFVVEDGRRVAPLEAMRFDDSLYGLLGERLAGLGAERHLLPDGGTYGERSLACMALPGALVEGFRLVL